LNISLRHAGLSDVGRQREINEDAFCALARHGLFVVADGMGGHKAGDVASKMATDAVMQFFTATEGEDSTWPFHFDPKRTYEENRLLAGVKLANRRIFEASVGNPDVQGMGTTIVSCVFSATGEKVYIGHVGDSRCYRLRGGEFELLTRDHSLVNDYRQAMPHLSEEQMAALPRNVITRALGMQETVVVDVQARVPRQGDVFLLCSDGLSEAVPEEFMKKTLADHVDQLQVAASVLVARANESGGDDNITVVLVAVDSAKERGTLQEEADGPDSMEVANATTEECFVEPADAEMLRKPRRGKPKK
jgi:protein phosphatase